MYEFPQTKIYVKQAHLIGGHFEIQDSSLNQMIQYIVLIGLFIQPANILYRNQHQVSVRLIDDDTGKMPPISRSAATRRKCKLRPVTRHISRDRNID